MWRFTSYLTLTVAIGCMLGTEQVNRSPDLQGDRKGANMLATKRFYSKGGIGAIGIGLYVDLKSVKNELVLKGGERWKGRDVPTPEVVLIFEGKVSSSATLPVGFDLSRAVVVSFEGEKVRFFEFDKMSGGYYVRPQED